MENASKALLIAGGILLAILILGLLALLLSSLSSNQLAEEKKTEAKQLQEFNQQWEAYNKKALFGSEIITVVDKAIQNNKSAETMDEKNKFYVNVTIDCKNTTFDTKITKIDLKTGTTTDEVEEIPATANNGTKITKESVSLSGITELGSWQTNGKLAMSNKVVEKFKNTSYKEKYEDKQNNAIYYLDSAFKVFKTTPFKCKGIDYDNGRVHAIHFEIR